MDMLNNSNALAHVELVSETGFRVVIIDRGASIASISLPTDEGQVDVAMRYAALTDYVSDAQFVGATVGRFANRIADGRLRLNGDSYQLATSPETDGHCLHGGPGGLHTRRWLLDPAPGGQLVRCHYISPHGEEGFPGRLDICVIYQLVDESSLAIDFEATCDRETVVNLANHVYFNLDPHATTIDDHELRVNAAYYTPVDDSKIPTGVIESVADSRMDFRSAARLGERLEASNGSSAGYDHNFVLNGEAGELRLAATLYSPASGIRLAVETTQPGLQLYTGDGLGAPFERRAGLCLEAQNFPDSPNHPNFPSSALAVGDAYRQRTVYRFSTDE